MKNLALLIAFTFSINAWSQIYSGATSTATGKTGRAAVEPGDAGFINAANLVHLKGRSFYSSYAPGEMAVAFTENAKDSLFPSSLGFFQHEIGDGTTIQDFRLAVAEFGSKKLAFGIAPHFYQVENNKNRKSQFDGDIGMTFTPTENLGVALVGYDLLEDSKDIAEVYKPMAKSAIGLNYVYMSFLRLRFDLQSRRGHRWNDPSIGSGIESYVNKWVVARFGYLSDRDLKEEIASFGIGFDLPRFRLNYAMAAQASELRDPRHLVDLSIPF